MTLEQYEGILLAVMLTAMVASVVVGVIGFIAMIWESFRG